jgi:hypothetical protein
MYCCARDLLLDVAGPFRGRLGNEDMLSGSALKRRMGAVILDLTEFLGG